MPSFAIKLAGTEDIGTIIGIQEKTWEPTYREILSREQIEYMFEKIYSYDALKKSILLEGQQFLLLISGEQTIGFAAVSEAEPGCFKLHKVYLLPSSQGTGAGRHLLTAAEEYVKSVGGRKMTLNVNKYNKAKSFYEKMNYKVIREEDIPIGPYWMNDYVLEKDLF
ncbi:GNAT family N-acetyltransferase [Dyadobacter psychrotolerans]|uniref:GNAT family N-acetyltransferase n=1 Tax=Dyadobacter psychrotolerans TaxID=2541721 RepID=A0A4R5DT40_9BACT|nr:GNAT family N-acetyltransferase [Dyadobacter psychrotolerans]TDE15544.1 GNAT family N-acetyltransferase [Dyadobacter psychrotolerans]